MPDIALVWDSDGVSERDARAVLNVLQARFRADMILMSRCAAGQSDAIERARVVVALLGGSHSECLAQLQGPFIPVFMGGGEQAPEPKAWPHPGPLFWTPSTAPAAERRLIERIGDELIHAAEPLRRTGARDIASRVAEQGVRVGRLPWRRVARAGAAITLAAYAALMMLTPHPYVWIPPGVFAMGCSGAVPDCDADELPVRQVTISHGFWMSRTEVTVAQYAKFAAVERRPLPPSPSFDIGWRGSQTPIVNVTWDEAAEYCRWAGGRLPTEAEWEYAARGGLAGCVYPWGNQLERPRANYLGLGERDHFEATAPAASFPPNGYGLYDIAGNAWEWTADYYSPSAYRDGSCADPRGPAEGTSRVVRGGGWAYSPRNLRVSSRNAYAADTRGVAFGFRCVRGDE